MPKHHPYLFVAFASSGIVMVMLALAFAYVPHPGVMNFRRAAPSAKPHVVALATNAFGSLADATAGATNAAAGGTVQAAARDMASTSNGSEGALAAPTPATPPVAGGGTVSTMTATANGKKVMPNVIVGGPVMPPYQPVTYKYVYKGDPIQAPAPQMDVYRHKAMSSLTDAPAGVLQSAGLGSIDLGSFSSVKMQNVTFVEDRDNGYVITTDFQNGTVSINQNWDRMTNNPYLCVKGVCPTVEPLTADKVPADDVLVRTANDFLSSHGVDASLYGTPVVDHSWRVYAMGGGVEVMNGVAVPDAAPAPAATKDIAPSVMPIRAPDQISIVYPYLVDGQEVVSTNGDPIGMNVSVNIRDKSVAGVYGIALQSYEKSSYATEQDMSWIMTFVERGGVYGYTDPNAKAVDVELGKPSVELASFGRQTADGTWEDLYVPSLVFPVVKKPADASWLQNSVVVPLIKDLLQEPNQPVPVPLMKAGVGGGSTGSSGSAGVVTPEVQVAPASAKR